MFFTLAACGNDHEYQENDFSLTLMISNSEASVGDTVTVTAMPP